MNAAAALPVVGVDLAKSAFQLAVADASWRVVKRQGLTRTPPLQGLHRTRSLWMATRASRINALRGFCHEFGIVIAQGSRLGVGQIGRALADPHAAVPTLIRQTMKLLVEEVHVASACAGKTGYADGQQAVEGMVRPCPGGGFASASASKSRRQPGATGRARTARDKLSLVANAGRAAQ